MADRSDAQGQEGKSLWRELAVRLLSGEEPAGVREEQPCLFTGEIPEDLRAEIPVPEGLTVVGGIVRNDPWHSKGDTEVVLDAPIGAAEVLASFRELLRSEEHAARGWEERGWPLGREGGFASGPVGERTVFCRGDRGPALVVCAYPREMAATDVRLLLAHEATDFCASEEDDAGSRRLASDIPVLTPPPGARDLGEGGRSFGEWSEDSTTAIRTDLDPMEVVEHYSSQLEAAGWTRVGDGSGGYVAWTAWELTAGGDDSLWRGHLSAEQLSRSESTYRLRVSIHRA